MARFARVTLSESRFGEQLDTGVDQLTHLSALIGVLIGWWRQGIGRGRRRAGARGHHRHAARAAVGHGAGAARPRADQFFVPTKPIEIAHLQSRRGDRRTAAAGGGGGVRPVPARSVLMCVFRAVARHRPSAPRFRRPLAPGSRSSSSRSPCYGRRWIERCEKPSVRAPLHHPQCCQCQVHRPQREGDEPLEVAEQHERRDSVATDVVAEQVPAADRASRSTRDNVRDPRPRTGRRLHGSASVCSTAPWRPSSARWLAV